MSILSAISNSRNPDVTVRDYQHAAATFAVNNNALLPKTKYWYHVFFQMNQAAYQQISQNLMNDTEDMVQFEPSFNGLSFLSPLIKSVKLPSIKFETKKHNQYNKWALNTTKVDYDPVTITMHNDASSFIEGFWYAYYQYMIADPKYAMFNSIKNEGINYLNTAGTFGSSQGNISPIYCSSNDAINKFGLDTFDASDMTPSTLKNEVFYRNQPFFDAIRIFQFSRAIDVELGPTYDEFVLVNPIISSYDHDTLEYSSQDFVTNSMTIEYETVLYNRGYLKPDEDYPDIASWQMIFDYMFDSTPSPLGNVPGSINIINANQLNVETTETVQSAEALTNTVQTITTGITENPAATISFGINQTLSVLGDF